jgi:hypothetical protein
MVKEQPVYLLYWPTSSLIMALVPQGRILSSGFIVQPFLKLTCQILFIYFPAEQYSVKAITFKIKDYKLTIFF